MHRVDQFHSGTAVGDAVTQQMFFLRDQLRDLGWQSDVYAQHIAPDLAGEIRSIDHYRPSPADLLLVHHSMGHTAFDRLIAANVRIVTVFHSITPARFFDDPGLRYHVRLGLQQLRVLAKRSLFGVAVSNHNRREMLDAGFSDVVVLPVRTDFTHAREARARRRGRSTDWLFVGRIAPNKRQVDVVRAFAAYSRSYDRSARLTLVGDTSMVDVVDDVFAEAERLQVRQKVVLTGKVDEETLWDTYSRSGLLVCLSQHEGFGVPVLEAMAAGLPVIALREAAVPETMGGAGILLTDNDPWTVAALAHVLATDDALRERLIEHQDRRIERVERFDVTGMLGGVIARADGAPRPVTVQVQGPFETTYSLAVLNRELALGLDSDVRFDVSIHATEGPGDYLPQPSDLAQHPRASELYAKSVDVPYPDVVIRQMYPPRVDDSPGAMTFQYFGWEESRLPQEYVDEFNAHLDGIGTMSTYVCDVLRGSGATVPMTAVGVGVRPPGVGTTEGMPEITDLDWQRRGTRFLHISSAFPRKGVDVLLEAYFRCFTGDDDVSLVLKTHPNPHNITGALLDDLRRRHANPPDVRWIDRDLTRDQLDGLYRAATSYVHPARGEGFGLPVAEAMLAEVPVISVSATGLADFVNADTAATISYTVEPADTHLTVPGSMWVEPDVDELVDELRSAARGDDADLRRARVAAARALVQEQYSWEAVTRRWIEFIEHRRRHRPGIKVAMVSTWNSRCGIAEYTRTIADALGSSVDVEAYADRGVTVLDSQVEESVFRSWQQNIDDAPDDLHEALERSTADIVHIQYNFGFFGARHLAQLIEDESAKRPVVVTLHRTADLEIPDRVLTLSDIPEGLRAASRIIVHQEDDVERLAELGVTDNVSLIPIGCDPPLHADMQEMRSRHDIDSDAFVVATFGFLLPHKGTIELIAAIAALRQEGIDARLLAVCSIHPDPSSTAYRERCAAEIRRLGLERFVTLTTEYLPDHVGKELLAAADVIALPYGYTRESSSAALRFVLPLGRPIVVSDVPIFDDARAVLAHVASPVDVDELSKVLAELHRDPDRREDLATAAEHFCIDNSWPAVAARLRDVYDGLVRSDGS